jgi:tetratricopeptide (TPR) repeat protein
MVIIRKKQKESVEEKAARLKKEQEQAIGIQDQYQSRGFELVSWVQEHKVLVSILISILIISGASVSVYLYFQKQKIQDASQAYLDILREIDDVTKTDEESIEKLKNAKEKLRELAVSYSGVKVANLANLYAAHLALKNDAKVAIELYQKALNDLQKTDPLYSLALIGLGYAKEKTGDQKNALSHFEAVIESKNSLGKDLALWEAARIAKDLNEVEKMKKYSTKLQDDFPESGYERNIKLLN